MRKTPTQHQYKRGQSGNPKGRPPGVLKELRSVMIRVLSETDTDGQQTIELIVRKLTAKALKGDIASAQVLFDRVYGKVPQNFDVDLEIENPIVKMLKMTNAERADYIKMLECKIRKNG